MSNLLEEKLMKNLTMILKEKNCLFLNLHYFDQILYYFKEMNGLFNEYLKEKSFLRVYLINNGEFLEKYFDILLKGKFI